MRSTKHGTMKQKRNDEMAKQSSRWSNRSRLTNGKSNSSKPATENVFSESGPNIGHGGKRDNAGRHKLPASKVKKPVCLKLSPDVIKWLKRQPAGIGPTVEILIRQEIEAERD